MRSAVAALGLFTAWLLSWGSGVGSANGPVLTAYLMSGLPYLAPHLSLYSPLSRCTPVIGYTWDALYPVYGISCLPNTLYTLSILYILYILPLYSSMLYPISWDPRTIGSGMAWILGPLWIWPILGTPPVGPIYPILHEIPPICIPLTRARARVPHMPGNSNPGFSVTLPGYP